MKAPWLSLGAWTTGRRTGFLLSTATAMLPTLGRAQLCAGMPSLQEQPVIATVDASRAQRVWSAGVGITAGRRLFAGVGAGTITYEDVAFAAQTHDASSFVGNAGIGYELPVWSEPAAGEARFGVCPVLTAEWESGPDGDFGGTPLDSDGWTFGAGISAGGLLLSRPPWRLFGFAGAAFVHVAATVHDFPFPGTDTEARDDGWLLTFGVGVGIGPRVTVSPSLAVPSGVTGGEETFSLGINVGFGRGVSQR